VLSLIVGAALAAWDRLDAAIESQTSGTATFDDALVDVPSIEDVFAVP
jgi:hypothetical protein